MALYIDLESLSICLLVVPAEKHPSMYPTHSIAYFSLPLSVSEKNVQKSTLLVYISTPRLKTKRQTSVQLIISETRHASKPFVNRTVELSPRGHWEHIDVTQEVVSWAADEDINYGFIVTAMYEHTNIAYLNDDPNEIEKQETVIGGDIVTRPHRVSQEVKAIVVARVWISIKKKI